MNLIPIKSQKTHSPCSKFANSLHFNKQIFTMREPAKMTFCKMFTKFCNPSKRIPYRKWLEWGRWGNGKTGKRMTNVNYIEARDVVENW